MFSIVQSKLKVYVPADKILSYNSTIDEYVITFLDPNVTIPLSRDMI